MFSIGNALGQGFKIWGRNIVPFTLLSAILYAPVYIWVFLTLKPTMTLSQWETMDRVMSGVPVLINVFITGAVTYGVVMEMRGQHAGMGASVAAGLSRFLPALGVSLLSVLAMIGGFIACVIPFFIIFPMLYVAVPASIMEKPGLIGALKRSRELTQGNKLSIFGLVIVLGLATGIPQLIIQKAIVPDLMKASFDDIKLSMYVEMAFTVVVGTLGAVVAAVTYFQLRQDKDGVSIDEIARVFD